MVASRAVLVAALASVAVSVAVAADDVVTVGRDARTGLALVVYAHGAGSVVQDVRQAALPRGASAVRFVDVPAQLDPRSVSLRAQGGGVDVLTQRFRHDLASPDLLLARWIGTPVELVETDRDLRIQVTQATLLAVQPTRVFRIGDRIVLDHPGRLQLPPAAEAPVLEPTLTWSVRSERAREAALEATYATAGLGWQADYVLTMAADERRAALVGWITLTNDSGTVWEDADVAVVAGEVHRVRDKQQPMVRALAMEAGAAPDAGPSETQPFEYHRYDLPGRTSLAPGETTQVRLLEAAAVPIEKRWVVEAHAIWHRGADGDVEEPLPVQARLALVNDEASGLGRLLPAGVVRVHATDAEGRSTFAGEDGIGHVAQDERVTLSVGRATDVVATRRQTEHRRISVKPYEVETATEVRVRNRKKTRAVTVEIRESIGGTWTVVESNHPAERLDATTLGFEVAVPAGGETVVRYRLQVGR